MVKFKVHVRNVFVEYRASNMGTSKWYSMEHSLDSLRELGGVEYLNGGLYENSHRRFKEEYRLKSKRFSLEMEETMTRQSRRLLA